MWLVHPQHIRLHVSSWEQGSLVVKVHLAVVLIKHHVLQHRAKADGLPDLWLALLLEADALGVAAALDVEHPVVAPAVLVVPNQGPLGVCGQRGLARACTRSPCGGLGCR